MLETLVHSHTTIFSMPKYFILFILSAIAISSVAQKVERDADSTAKKEKA